MTADSYHNAGLRVDKTVVVVGRSEAGQCDVGRWHNIVTTTAGVAHTVDLCVDGGIVAIDSNGHGQPEVGAWSVG